MADCHIRGRTRERWNPRPDGLEESVQFTPGYNCPDMSMQGHGVHGMEIRWLLRGPAGATHLVLATDWIPGELRPGHGLPPAGVVFPYSRRHVLSGVDLGYHARSPRYEGQAGRERCCWLDGPCWYDGSGLNADRLVPEFMADGESVAWGALESLYAELAEHQQ